MIKKIMINSMLSAVCASGAFADDQTDAIKSACKKSDETVWVAQNNICIPKNPCKDDKYKSYCLRNFVDFSGVDTYNYRISVALTYAINVLRFNSTRYEFLNDSKNDKTAVWLAVSSSDNYVVFQFSSDRARDEHQVFPEDTYVYAICRALGGDVSVSPFNPAFVRCSKISESDCNISNVFKPVGQLNLKYNSSEQICEISNS